MRTEKRPIRSCFLNARSLLWSWTPATALRAAAILRMRLNRREERQNSSILSRIPEKNGFNERLGSESDETPLADILEFCRMNGTEWLVVECEPDPDTDTFTLAAQCRKLLKEKNS